jgi:hypothetical protein
MRYVNVDPINTVDPRGDRLVSISQRAAQGCASHPYQSGCVDPCQPNRGIGLLDAAPAPEYRIGTLTIPVGQNVFGVYDWVDEQGYA